MKLGYYPRQRLWTVDRGLLLMAWFLGVGGCSNHGGSTRHDSTSTPLQESTSQQEGELLEFVKLKSTMVAGAPYRLEGWSDYTFEQIAKKTRYRVVIEEGRPVLYAHSEGGASAVRRDVAIDPIQRSTITWTWKVAQSLEQADCTKKSGDDSAARVMLLYRHDPGRAGVLERARFESAKSISGKYPPFAMLVYAWTESARNEEWITSPYSDRVKVFPIRKGSAKAGEWVTETRNHLEDFRKAFGTEPTTIEGVALMVDTDNTGTEATAWFRSLRFPVKPR